MAQVSQVPEGSWWKWILGIGVGAIAIYGGATALGEMQKPDPWKGAPPPKKRTDFQGLEYVVFQDPQSEQWDLWATEYLIVEDDLMFVASLRGTWAFDTKKEAVDDARARAKRARTHGNYKLVRVVASAADHRAAAERRERQRELAE